MIKEFWERSYDSGSRSTILKPLLWGISICLSAMVVLVKAGSPEWMLMGLGIIIVALIVTILFAYLFCLFKDRDALRSEKYSIQKIAMEKGLYGDDKSGIFEKVESSKKIIIPIKSGDSNIDGSKEESKQ